MTANKIILLSTILISMIETKAFAYDIEVKNADGVTIYYNYVNDNRELEVTRPASYYHYTGTLVIPDEVTYMNRTRKVTSIESKLFCDSRELTSVTVGNNVETIRESTFSSCSNLSSVIIGDGVTSIGDNAFSYCNSLSSITIGNNVKSIGQRAFYHCNILNSVTIGNNLTNIGEDAFGECRVLNSVHIKDLEAWCKIKFCDIFSNPLTYAHHLYINGTEIKDLIIPNSVKDIGAYTFYYCSGLNSVTIGNGVMSIGESAFKACKGLTSITIGKNVTSIGTDAFNADIPTIISLIENPFEIASSTFSNNTFLNATLYVPVGCIDKYKSTGGWNAFSYVTELNNDIPTPQKCDKPTISYNKGKLTFFSTTEGVTFQSTITDMDINSYSSNEVQLGVTYLISVYASRDGYENSDVATATLCWIDVEPKTDGIENGVANVRALAVMIQNEDGLLSVSGIDDGTHVRVYNINGIETGTAISRNGVAIINTNLQTNSIAIIKVGGKSIKVVLK